MSRLESALREFVGHLAALNTPFQRFNACDIGSIQVFAVDPRLEPVQNPLSQFQVTGDLGKIYRPVLICDILDDVENTLNGLDFHGSDFSSLLRLISVTTNLSFHYMEMLFIIRNIKKIQHIPQRVSSKISSTFRVKRQPDGNGNAWLAVF